MARKTFSVTDLRDQVNRYLATPAFPGAGEAEARVAREAVAGMLESVLFATGNYHGFRLLASEFLPAEEQNGDNVLRLDYDGSRRHYL
jgi:hypothetical protein